jgi:hypothetical protein
MPLKPSRLSFCFSVGGRLAGRVARSVNVAHSVPNFPSDSKCAEGLRGLVMRSVNAAQAFAAFLLLLSARKACGAGNAVSQCPSLRSGFSFCFSLRGRFTGLGNAVSQCPFPRACRQLKQAIALGYKNFAPPALRCGCHMLFPGYLQLAKFLRLQPVHSFATLALCGNRKFVFFLTIACTGLASLARDAQR